MGVAVAKQPKKNSGKAPESSSQGDVKEENATKMVRFRPEFQKRLIRVAKDAGMGAGEFVEAQLTVLVNREFKRIVLKEAEEVKGE